MDIFVSHYLRTSEHILRNEKAHVKQLPRMFVQLVETGQLATSTE